MPSSSRRSWFRLPRPKTFLGLLSLQTGTELISLALIFNKATGVYGILTLFTGYKLSALQVSTYLASILVLVALGLCVPHIRKQSPFHNLALAWLYAIDTVVSAAYTTVFATSWYLAAIHDPERSVAAAQDVVSPSDGDPQLDPSQAGPNKAGTGVQETAASMVLVIGFALIRFYFSLVIMAYARTVLLRFDDERAAETEEDGPKSTASNPFAVGAPLGEGWKGRLGRVMVSIGRGYWLGGRKEDEEWARDVHSKFRSSR
ncbi:hypothetical protein VTK56DRAFT_4956 [Thermocarpiscus australiensis]